MERAQDSDLQALATDLRQPLIRIIEAFPRNRDATNTLRGCLIVLLVVTGGVT